MQSALAVVLAIVLCSITGTCGRTLSPSQSLSNSTTQLTLFQQIAADLAPYAKCGISQAMIDGVYCGIQDPGFRVQIKHNKVYIAGEVKGFQSRNRNVKLALLDMASHYKRLPDVDFVVGTADFSASEVRPVLGMTEGGPVFAQGKRRNHTTAILFPDHTFTDWQEAATASWQHEQFIMQQAALHHPWALKDSRLLFRGSSITGNRQIAVESKPNSQLDVKVWDWTQEEDSRDFFGLPDHCKSKYLLNWPGNSYSARLKYLLLCGSVVVHSDNGWYEFYYPMLEHGKHYMRTRALASPTDLSNGLTGLVRELQANPKRSRLIAKAGQDFAVNVLSADNIREYWYKLLKAYSALQLDEVSIDRDAVPLGNSLSRPVYVQLEQRSGCGLKSS